MLNQGKVEKEKQTFNDKKTILLYKKCQTVNLKWTRISRKTRMA